MIYSVFVFLNFFLFVSPIYADDLSDRLRGVLESGTGTGEPAFANFVQAVLNFAVPLGVFAAFVLLGYSAFIMITSAGNPEKLKEAKEVATNAIIGAVMIALSVIVLVVLDDALELGIGSVN